MFAVTQLLAHGVGDYMLQSDWMAQEKTKRFSVALLHALTYALPFLLVTQSAPALLVIVSTHALIDRYRLARYVCWVKNFLAPKWIEGYFEVHDDGSPIAVRIRNYPWEDCVGTGYHKDRPAFLTVWLLIITDNLMHVLINGLAIEYLGGFGRIFLSVALLVRASVGFYGPNRKEKIE
jgi:hypothetical protein